MSLPRNNDRIRTPSFRSKLSQLKGFSGDEKALIQRIGNLVDVLQFNQRQESNPGRGRRSRQLSAEVPQILNLTIVAISGGVQVFWDPVDFRELSFYEVQFSESSSFLDERLLEVVDTKATIKSAAASNQLFVRVRIVSKRDLVGEWSTTVSSTFSSGASFQADGDFIDPENRTTVETKPLLTTGEFTGVSLAFVGVGAHTGPSPITLTDSHPFFTANPYERNEITYDLFEINEPFPSIEQRYTQNFGQFIDNSGFYVFNNSEFYMQFSTMTNSFTDFFNIANINVDPAVLQVEWLRYRVFDSDFYLNNFAQTGIVLNATLGITAF